MTPYHFVNQDKKKKLSQQRMIIGASISIGVIALLFLVAPWIMQLLKGPLWLATSVSDSVDTLITRTTPKSIILNRYEALRAQVTSLESAALERDQLKIENEALRASAGYHHPLRNTQTVQVISKTSQSLFNTFVIDAGSDSNIQEGALVTTQGTLGIGIVSHVSPTTAIVSVFGEPSFSGELLFAGKSVIVPAIGKGSGNFEIHIPREIVVSEGDILTFPSDPSIVVGVVKSITFDPRDPFQTVLARSPVNVQELRFVQVVQ